MGRLQVPDAAMPAWRRVELPTWAVAAAIYLGWLAATWWHAALPWWLLAAVGGYLVAWHGSLQHEVIHGHPTRIRWVNTLLALPPLGLWFPFPTYRDSHLIHHRNQYLTCPINDPESYYVLASDWEHMGGGRRRLLRVLNTFAGRLILGPPVIAARFWWAELKAILGGDRHRLGVWSVHLLLVAGVLAWVTEGAGMSLGEYLLCFVYPGLSLTLMRSFHEHRAVAAVAQRTASVEAGPLFALLYLNNNLHALHHEEPTRPWYELPGVYRQRRPALAEANGGFVFNGYGEVARRFVLSLRDTPVHPSAVAASAAYAAPDLRRAT
jgi:fatty acid desaturase